MSITVPLVEQPDEGRGTALEPERCVERARVNARVGAREIQPPRALAAALGFSRCEKPPTNSAPARTVRDNDVRYAAGQDVLVQPGRHMRGDYTETLAGRVGDQNAGGRIAGEVVKPLRGL